MSNSGDRRGLGRGLSALMADVDPTLQSPAMAREKPSERLLPIEKIEPNPDQPRRQFSDDALQELASSIAEKGVIQPLIVRKHPKKKDFYEIVAGERRWRASQIAQLHELPVIIRDFSDTEVLEVAIIENIQRADLNAIEEAAGYRALMDRFGHTQEKLSAALGKSRSHIANSMRLLNLPETIQQLVIEDKISAGHARVLVGRPDGEALAQRIISEGLSVRDIEKISQKQNDNRHTGSKKKEKDADTQAIERDLSAALDMKVSINQKTAQRGELSIQYRDLDELDDLCRLLSRVDLQ